MSNLDLEKVLAVKVKNNEEFNNGCDAACDAMIAYLQDRINFFLPKEKLTDVGLMLLMEFETTLYNVKKIKEYKEEGA